MKKTVLVTGGFGYVGSVLTPKLLKEGYHVKVIDLCLYGDAGLKYLESQPQYSEWKNRFEFIKADIRDGEILAKAMKGTDFIIHLAAISNDPTGEIDEVLTRQVNFDCVGLLTCLAKEYGVKRFINASSSSVFGIKAEKEINESLEPQPLSYYSKYKALSEWIVLAASSKDFTTVNIRPATICGVSPRQRFDLTVNKLTVDAIEKGRICVHGGQQRRPNVGMTDIVNLYVWLLNVESEKINGKTFNFGFENNKIIDIAHIIKDELKDLDITIDVTESFDQRDYHISSDKILSELNFNPTSSIRNEVRILRKSIEDGIYDVESSLHYNMQSMQLERNASAYDYLSR